MKVVKPKYCSHSVADIYKKQQPSVRVIRATLDLELDFFLIIVINFAVVCF